MRGEVPLSPCSFRSVSVIWRRVSMEPVLCPSPLLIPSPGPFPPAKAEAYPRVWWKLLERMFLGRPICPPASHWSSREKGTEWQEVPLASR